MPKRKTDRREFLKKLGGLGLGVGVVVAGNALGFSRVPEPEQTRRDVRLHMVEGAFADVLALRDYLKIELAKPENAAGTHFFLLGEGTVLGYFKKTREENRETAAEIAGLLKKHGDAHVIFTAYDLLPRGSVSNTLWFLSPGGLQLQPKRKFTRTDRAVLEEYLESLHPADPEQEFADRSGQFMQRGIDMNRGAGEPFPSVQMRGGFRITAANCLDARDAAKRMRGKEVLFVPAHGFPFSKESVRGVRYGAVNDVLGGKYGHKIFVGTKRFSLTPNSLPGVNAALSSYGVRILLEHGGAKK